MNPPSSTSELLQHICQRNVNVYRASPARLREDVSQEAQVASDYRGRLAYELLQNADDAMLGSGSEDDRIWFVLRHEELWVGNTGRPLSAEDVKGLCGMGASTKTKVQGARRASIGHKGMGFKSVLEITGRPSVYSTTHTFELNEASARRHIEPLWEQDGRSAPQQVAVMRFPAPINTDHPIWDKLRSQGCNTAFRFPFRGEFDAEQRSELATLLLDLPLSTVLFLKNLDHVTVNVELSEAPITRSWRIRRRIRTEEGLRSVPGYADTGVYRVEVADDGGTHHGNFIVAHDADVVIGTHRGGLSDPGWEGVERTEVSIACLAPDENQPPLPRSWRQFHVFLPTDEPSPYPLLVNGAFMSNLSRQHVRVTRDHRDYNAHLVREAARVYREHLLPILMEAGADVALESLDRGEAPEEGGLSAAQVLHEALRDELAGVPLVPADDGQLLALDETVFPPWELGGRGDELRRVLPREARWGGAGFPAPEFCTGRFSRIAEDHGARTLTPLEALDVLAGLADPERSRLRPDDSGRFQRDPVLEIVVALWHETAGEDRTQLEQRARKLPLFPIERNPDDSVRRVVMADRTAFYPPQSTSPSLPLEGLAFLCHDLCWGRLSLTERSDVLADEMGAWSALFEIREFRFEEVMRAAVLPGLVLEPVDEARGILQGLESMGALAAICQLAGRKTKPDQPLRYERLGNERGLFNLSRLPVPCRSPDGPVRWMPAYRVYFGADWIGDRSVERVVQAREGTWTPPDIPFLAPPEEFMGELREFAGLEEDGEPDAEDGDVEDELDEVDVEEDPDRAHETDERERWIAFLSWIGVNQCLRPVHFHDVQDKGATWLKTGSLTPPGGWAFDGLGSEWEDLREEALVRAREHSAWDDSEVYLYEAHRLEHVWQIADAAAADPSGTLARALMGHLARHWPFLERYSIAAVAVVNAKSPGRRRPPKAHRAEVMEVGDDLWVRELANLPILPTSNGPRRPQKTWLLSDEVRRRFGRGNQDPGNYLPVLEPGEGVPGSQLRALGTRLGLRSDLSPSTFEVEDARIVAENLTRLYEIRGVSAEDLRRINPVYREIFELLSGSDVHEETAPLRDVRLLARSHGQLAFWPAHEVVYAATPGALERAGLTRSWVPTFVVQAEPTATRPLREIFGVRRLEDALERKPDPGEPALHGHDLERFREELRKLTRILLARLQVDRGEPRQAARDREGLRTFVERVEPVLDLNVELQLSGRPIEVQEQPGYFVESDWRSQELLAFITWADDPWPPQPEHAQSLAMAMAETLQVNLVEAFLAFIDNDEAGRRRLLGLAGGIEHLERLDQELDAMDGGEEEAQELELERTAATQDDRSPIRPTIPPAPTRESPAPPRIPLVSLEELTFAGTPITIFGTPDASSGGRRSSPASAPSSERTDGTGGSGARAAPGVDISHLDRLGMRIAMAYEVRRLRKADVEAVIFDGTNPDPESRSSVFDVSTPEAIRVAQEASPLLQQATRALREFGVSEIHPGFDILTIRAGEVNRLIELKSSAVDARIQTMTWNEWKSASKSRLREQFWLYLVGNLRADMPHQTPYVRAIRDPFGTLMSAEIEQEVVRRAVQLRVREFQEAEHLDLG